MKIEMIAVVFLIAAALLSLMAEKTKNPLWSLGVAVFLIAVVLIAERLI